MAVAFSEPSVAVGDGAAVQLTVKIKTTTDPTRNDRFIRAHITRLNFFDATT
jgi:hypothetical protein